MQKIRITFPSDIRITRIYNKWKAFITAFEVLTEVPIDQRVLKTLFSWGLCFFSRHLFKDNCGTYNKHVKVATNNSTH